MKAPSRARITAAFLALALAACGSRPQPADPAIWQVTGPGGQRGWLFGTIHAAPTPLQWKTAAVADALDEADSIVVEVANLADDEAVARTFADLSRSPGLPPMAARVAPDRRRALSEQLSTRDIDPASVRDVETWAVALMLARPESGADSLNGVDRAVLVAGAGKRVVELEGARAQLSIFDRLAEADQRDLLHAVLADGGALDDEADLVDVWRRGDMARIEAETRTGLLADPELRFALFTRRNARWTQRIAAELQGGRHPFVAVGAAHMAGPEGLVAMLRVRGYTVTRLP